MKPTILYMVGSGVNGKPRTEMQAADRTRGEENVAKVRERERERLIDYEESSAKKSAYSVP